MEPIDLLKQELNKWMKALKKSEQSFEKGQITKEEHETHRENLTPKIDKYRHAVQTLQMFG